MSSNRIRIACVGCGPHAATSIQPGLAGLEAFDFAGVCDLDPARAERQARRFRLKTWTTDWRELLDREPLDAVAVVGPPSLHEEVGLEAIRRGLHLFLEKPPSMTVDGARRLVEAARGTSAKQMVGLMWRHAPAHRMAKEIMQRPEFGRSLGFQARYVTPGPGLRADWGLGAERRARYFLLDHVIHLIDCTRFLMGEIEEVQAAASPPEWDREIWQVILQFESGAVGTMTLAHRSPSFDAFVYVLGDGPARVQVHNWQRLEYAPPQPWAGQGGYTDHPVMTWDSGIGYLDGVNRPGYREELEGFACAVREGAECHADLEDAYRAMVVVDAIEASLHTGQPVMVDYP